MCVCALFPDPFDFYMAVTVVVVREHDKGVCLAVYVKIMRQTDMICVSVCEFERQLDTYEP